MKYWLKKFIWEIINPLILRCRRRYLRDWNGYFKGLNLGCGLDVLPQWIGIDGGVYVLLRNLPLAILRLMFPMLEMSKVYSFEDYIKKLKSIYVIHHDLRYGIPFISDVVPNIYSSHLLEHFTKDIGTQLIKECFRVLCSEGIIRITVPLIHKEDNEISKTIMQYDHGEIQQVPECVMRLRQRVFWSEYSVHRHIYNFYEIKMLLESCGFIDVVERQFCQGRISDVDKIDSRKDSLFVEARKSMQS